MNKDKCMRKFIALLFVIEKLEIINIKYINFGIFIS